MNDDPFAAGIPGMEQLSASFAAWGRAIQQATAGNAEGASWAAPDWQHAAGGPWLLAIYQLARQGVEQNLDSSGLVAAWRQILRQGLWPDAPVTGAADAAAWFDLPAFGPWREHVGRWQQQARQSQQAQAGLLQWQTLMADVREAALARFEALLRDRESTPLTDVRGLFDLWIEAAEQAWEQSARSPVFADGLAAMSQAQLDAWQAHQAEAQRGFEAMGLVTRRELEQAWQRIDALERQVAALLAAGGAAQAAPAPSDATGKAANATPRKRAASKRTDKATPVPARMKTARATAVAGAGTRRPGNR